MSERRVRDRLHIPGLLLADRVRHPRSTVLRETEVYSAVARIRPAARHDLAARKKVDALGPISVRVPEERVLPSPERVVPDGNRDRYVHTDHAHLDLILETPCGSAVVGEDCSAIPPRIVVYQPESSVVRRNPHYRENRAKDL